MPIAQPWSLVSAFVGVCYLLKYSDFGASSLLQMDEKSLGKGEPENLGREEFQEWQVRTSSNLLFPGAPGPGLRDFRSAFLCLVHCPPSLCLTPFKNFSSLFPLKIYFIVL